MSSIRILPIGDPEPDLTIYQPIRQTRRFKYYAMINNPNQMEITSIMNQKDDDLDFLTDLLTRQCILKGGKIRTRKNRKHRRKSRKSRKY